MMVSVSMRMRSRSLKVGWHRPLSLPTALLVFLAVCGILMETASSLQALRLSGGDRPSRGRVEVLVRGQWGTVCDDFFDLKAAKVLCRQLRYRGDKVMNYQNAFFGQGSGPIWLDDIKCTGSEDSLTDCNHTQFGQHDCLHSEEAGVDCDFRSCDVCGNEWSPVDGSCYTIIVTTFDWHSARLECQKNGGDLAVMESHHELETVRKTNATGTDLWVGLRSECVTVGSSTPCWKWIEEPALVPTEMDWQQPDERNGKNETGHCAMLLAGNTTRVLADAPCEQEMFSLCEKKPGQTLLRRIAICKEVHITEDSMASIIDEIRDETLAVDTSSAPDQVDVVAVSSFIQTVNERVRTLQPETAQKLIGIVTQVQLKHSSADEEETQRSANRMIQDVEELGGKVDLRNSTNGRVLLVTPKLALEVMDVTKVLDDVAATTSTSDGVTGVPDDDVFGLKLLTDDGDVVSTVTKEKLVSISGGGRQDHSQTDTSIQMTAAFVWNIAREHTGQDIRVTMSVCAETQLFQHGRLQPADDDPSHTPALLNSKVVSARVTVDGQPITELGGGHVKAVFSPITKQHHLSEAESAPLSVCVFWDFSLAQGKGAWSNKGCHYSRTEQGKDVCVCDHLTHFAVLMKPDKAWMKHSVHDAILTVMTKAGLTLSVIGLSATVISFFVVKKWRRSGPQQVIFNLALSMLLAWLVFLLGFERVHPPLVCMLVAGLLHYLILVTFVWMMVEGVVQYMMVIKVTGNNFNNFMGKTAFPAWGMPLIPVATVVGFDAHMYRGYDTFCWMTMKAFYYAFLLPVCLVLAFNVVIYIMVVVKICRLPRIGQRARNSTMLSIRASVCSFVVLGLSWTLALLVVANAGVVAEYLFTITTSVQGLLIFILFTTRDPAFRAFWAQRLHSVSSYLRSAKSTSRESARDTHPNVDKDAIAMTSSGQKAAE